jgi:hypothetical protein
MNDATHGDGEAFHPGYGQGGVPWYLLALYIAFLMFFAWYVIEYQLPDYLEQGPVKPQNAPAAAR